MTVVKFEFFQRYHVDLRHIHYHPRHHLMMMMKSRAKFVETLLDAKKLIEIDAYDDIIHS